MCDLCYKAEDGFKEIGDIIVGISDAKAFFLIQEKEIYHILSYQGHGDDIIYTFSSKPYKDPWWGIPDEQLKKLDWKIYLAWVDSVDKENWKMQMRDGHNLVKLILKDAPKDRVPSNWLFHRCGELIDNHEASNETQLV